MPRALHVHARLVAHVKGRGGGAERGRKAPERGVDGEALQAREERRGEVRRLRVLDDVGDGALLVVGRREAQQVQPEARRRGRIRVLPQHQNARVLGRAVVERLPHAEALLEARAEDAREHDLRVLASTFCVRLSLLFCLSY